MLDTPALVQTTAQPAAVIRITVPRDEIQQAMCPAITEVMAAVTAQGAAPAGPIFSHHFRMSPDVFDFEVGVPLSTPINPVGRVQQSHLPAASVLRTVYTGPYEGLGQAWGEFLKNAEAAGHATAPNLRECYLTGPASDTDPSTWRTELNQPLLQ